MEIKEKQKEEIEEGEKEKNVYSEEGAEVLEEGGEIDELEEGFAEGYEAESNPSECALCHKTLKDENFIEMEINGEYYRFCCEEHAEEFKKKNENTSSR